MRDIHARAGDSTRFSTQSLAPAGLELDRADRAATAYILAGVVLVGDPSLVSV